MVTIKGTEFELSPAKTQRLQSPKRLREGHTLLNDIDYRIKRSHKLSLMMIGYRGDALIEMHRMLFGRKPKRSKPRIEPNLDKTAAEEELARQKQEWHDAMIQKLQTRLSAAASQQRT